MHEAARNFVEAHRAFVGWPSSGGTILELGSRDWNGTVRDLFGNARRYLGVDLAGGPGVNLVCDLHQLPSDLGVFDLVLCLEVLEHEPRWQEALSVLLAHARNMGGIIVTCAGEGRGPHDGGTDFYRNLGAGDLLPLAEGCSSWHLEYNGDAKDLYFAGVKRAT